MSVDRVQGKVRAQLWDSGSSSWIDAPGDATNGLKVQGPLTDAQLRASAVPVSGTFYQATQPVSLATAPSTPVTGTFWQSTQPVSLATNTPDVTDRSARLLGHVTVDSAPTTAVTGPLTDTQLRASAVPVSLASAPTTAVTGPLTDTQLRATAVPVSGPLTDTQLRATAVPVSGTVTASGPLTDTQLRATAVPVSGPLTDTQLRATAVPVSGTVAISNPTTNPETGLAKDATLTGGTAKAIVTPTADATSTGSFTANGDILSAAVTAGMTTWGAYFQGTYATGVTITFESSVDGGTTYSTALMQRLDALAASAITSIAPAANAIRFFQGPIPPGATHIRMRVSAWASPSGTINARISQRVMPVMPHVSLLQNTANPMQTQIGDGTTQATVSTAGRLNVDGTGASFPSKSIGASGSLGTVTAAIFADKAVWLVPANFTFRPTVARCGVTTAGSRTLIVAGARLATWNPGTDTFVADQSVAAPDFYDRLFYRVKTTHSATAVNVTATYTDELGNTGNTTSANAIPSAATGGQWWEFTLASPDVGVRAVTAVSDSANPTSVVDEIWGLRTLLEDLGPANSLSSINFAEQVASVPAGETIFVLMMGAATTAQQRHASVAGVLVPV